MSSKDRHFGEYVNEPGHRCPCYDGKNDGPPQYAPGDGYFCFSKFANPNLKHWASRYMGISIYRPNMEIIEAAERKMGRVVQVGEWSRIQGALPEGAYQIKHTDKAINDLRLRTEARLAQDMIDELDHRLFGTTAFEYQERTNDVLTLYAAYPWTTLGRPQTRDIMQMHSMINTLEMLRLCDVRYSIMPPVYHAEEREQTTTGRLAAKAIAGEDAIETTVVEPRKSDLRPPKGVQDLLLSIDREK